MKPDKTFLISSYKEALEIDKSKYIPKSIDYLENELVNVKIIIDDENSTKNEVDSEITKLNKIIEELIVKPDKTQLITEYTKQLALDRNTYLKTSLDEFDLIMSDVEKIIDDENSTLENVNIGLSKIEEARNLLVLKPDKSKLISLLERATQCQESKYTTVSYNSLIDTMSKIEVVNNNEEATQEEVDTAINILQESIDSLIVATKGVYRLRISSYRVYNNHVGNQWSQYYTCNGKEFNSYDTITAKFNSTVTIGVKIVERDSIPDVGRGTIYLKLQDGQEKSINIIVRENRGRYSGNTAKWEVTCSVELLERI